MTETPVELRDGSKIEWTDYTFNPWIGCARVSPGCQHCYAETMAGRYGWAEWGKNGTRRVTADSNWKKPLTWQRRAVRDGVRRRVFCASLADVFEDRGDLIEPRQRLFDLMAVTPDLDWLLLTKRPENVLGMVPAPWVAGYSLSAIEGQPALKGIPQWPSNVWLGTTVEDQERAELRIPELLAVTMAPVRFLSCEPLLGPLDLAAYLPGDRPCWDGPEPEANVDWIICGGESGHGARPMQPDWALDLRDQAEGDGVPFLFKQWGDWGPDDPSIDPKVPTLEGMRHVGKHTAGRLLEGRTWDQLPERTPA